LRCSNLNRALCTQGESSRMLSNQEIKLVEQLIRLHDGKNYSVLQDMSIPPNDPDDEATVTEDMYIKMCDDIERDMGDIESIEPIDVLVRYDSKLTLWKVKYRKSEFKAFWGISFDSKTLKIQDVMVQW
jgi:hypothetical protein